MGDATLQLDNFSPSARNLVGKAQQEADSGAYSATTLAHLALALLGDSEVQACAQRAGWDIEAQRAALGALRGEAKSKEPAYLSPALFRVLDWLTKASSTVTVRDLFFALVDEGTLPPTPRETWPQAPAPAPRAAEATSTQLALRLAVDVERALRPATRVTAYRALHMLGGFLERAVVPQLDIEKLPPDGLRFGRESVDDWIAAVPDEQGVQLRIYSGGEPPRLRHFALDEPSRAFVDPQTGTALNQGLCDEIRATLYPELRDL